MKHKNFGIENNDSVKSRKKKRFNPTQAELEEYKKEYFSRGKRITKIETPVIAYDTDLYFPQNFVNEYGW